MRRQDPRGCAGRRASTGAVMGGLVPLPSRGSLPAWEIRPAGEAHADLQMRNSDRAARFQGPRMLRVHKHHRHEPGAWPGKRPAPTSFLHSAWMRFAGRSVYRHGPFMPTCRILRPQGRLVRPPPRWKGSRDRPLSRRFRSWLCRRGGEHETGRPADPTPFQGRPLSCSILRVTHATASHAPRRRACSAGGAPLSP